MNAKLTINPKLLHQRSTSGELLLYLQSHPLIMRDTNFVKMAHTIKLSRDDLACNESTIQQTLCRMQKKDLLFRVGSKKRANFAINYHHLELPDYVLDEAPENIRDKVRKWREEISESAIIEKNGTVTEAMKQEVETEQPTNEQTETPEVVKDIKIDGESGTTIKFTFNIVIN